MHGRHMMEHGPGGWWAPRGFAGIPTTVIDPPHRAASPAVPALMGPGPHDRRALCASQSDGRCLGIHEFLELDEDL